MPTQLLLQNVVNETDQIKSGGNVVVVWENEELFSTEQSCPDRLQNCMLALGEQEGHESVSQFQLPFSLVNVELISPHIPRKLTCERTNGATRAFIMAFLEMESYAPLRRWTHSWFVGHCR